MFLICHRQFFFNHLALGWKKPVAVCTRGMMFRRAGPMVTRVIEWIELLRILGVEKIFLYYYDVEEYLMKALRHYEARGMVDLTQISLSGHRASDSLLQELTWKNDVMAQWAHDRIMYADCFYRAAQSYEFVAVLDVDEVGGGAAEV